MSKSLVSMLNNAMAGDSNADYKGSRAFSPDYSMSGRFTVSMINGDGGGRIGLYLAPEGESISKNSIGIYLWTAKGTISLISNKDLDHPLVTANFDGIKGMGAYSDIWYEYDGQTKEFKVYAAKYDEYGEVKKPATPIITYEIDLAEKFSGSENFTWHLMGRDGWNTATVYVRGVEVDPYPELNEKTPTPTPTPTPVSEGFKSFSQGNTEYGYKTAFVKEDWKYEGEAAYANESLITVLNNNAKLYNGSAFTAFANDVGEDYKFYTHFSFSRTNAYENGFAFVIQPVDPNQGFYGRNGYSTHKNSVIVEFDLDPQKGYYRYNRNGEFESYDESNAHVAVMLDGSEIGHYSVADFRELRELGRRMDAWVDYDGKTLSVYAFAATDLGRVYKSAEPLLKLDIDLKEVFDGNSNLYMGFIGGDYDKTSNLNLHGFEIAKEPFTAPIDETPIEDQERYSIMSMGDENYGYQTRFIPSEWVGQCTVKPSIVNIVSGVWNEYETICQRYRELPEDYSFSGRFTGRITGDDPGNYMSFFLSKSPTTRIKSVSIQLDAEATEDAMWRNAFGEPVEDSEDGWYHGHEPYDAMVAVCLNGNDRKDYAIAEYLPLRISGAVHEVWFNYDGTEKKLYVYIATYDENGHVEKPDTPIIVCPLDLEEVFEGEHRVYPAIYGETEIWHNAEFDIFGFELDPYPAIHNEFDGVLQVLAPLDNKIYKTGEKIDISGRRGPKADPDALCHVSLLDKDGKAVYQADQEVFDTFKYIDRIPTNEMIPGDYKIVLSLADRDGVDFVKEIPIKVVFDVKLNAKLTKIDADKNGLHVKGTIDCNEDSSYELQFINLDTDEKTTFATGTGNKTEEELGTLSLDGVKTGTYGVKLIVTSKSGMVAESQKDFDYTAPDEEITEDELFVDIADDQEGMEVPFITDIKGSVSGSYLTDYVFEVYPVGSDVAVYTSNGTEPVTDGTLGVFDPTLLLNGYYRIKVTAHSTLDVDLDDEITVLVCGNAKIGNYSMTFNDLTTGLQNFPITIYRTYDSRTRNISGDFGYGWEMSIGGPRISISGNLAEGWTQARGNAFVAGPAYRWAERRSHEITIDWGNGKMETFVMKLSPEMQNYMRIDHGISASLVAKDKRCTSKLEFLDQATGLWFQYDTLTHDIECQEVFNPQRFLLTARDGVKYYFELSKGLYKIEDTYGRTIEITDSGITYSDGIGMTIERDGEGRITSITDGKQSVSYTYDDNGDLTVFKDRAGNDTSFKYEEHYLTEISNKDHVLSKNYYDDDGRLVAIEDAAGNAIDYSHDLTEKSEIVTNRLGKSTVYTYDDYGNVLSKKDALGRVTEYTYDENHNLASKKDPMGKTTFYEYSAYGDLLSETDPLGNKVEAKYSSAGAITNSGKNNITFFSISYDKHQCMNEVRTSNGNQIQYQYDKQGNVIGSTDLYGTVGSAQYTLDGTLESVTNADNTKITYKYDNVGNLISTRQESSDYNLESVYEYDDYGNIVYKKNYDGKTTKYYYDALGNLTKCIDSLNNATEYEYDLFGNLVLVKYPDQTSEKFEYDAEGRRTRITDKLGNTTNLTYDDVGNLVRKESSGLVETFIYDDCDRVISATSSLRGTVHYSYDAKGRQTEFRDEFGHTTKYSYDGDNLESVTDANGNKVTFGYDSFGNKTSEMYPDGNSKHWTYDERGRMVSETDSYGNTTYYEYDSMNRVVAVKDPKGNATKYAYDSLGNISRVADLSGNATEFTFDDKGRVVEIRNAKGSRAEIAYNEAGQVVTDSDYGKNKYYYTYDKLGRITTIKDSLGNTDYTYDSKGQLIKVEDSSGSISYSYNQQGYITAQTDARGKTVYYTYDNYGSLTSVSCPDGSINYVYDAAGRLASVTDGENNTTKYSYDYVGNVTEIELPNGIMTSYEYDSLNHLIKQESKDSNGKVLARYEYTLGKNGEVLSCQELNRKVTYTYDEIERLVSETVESDGKITKTSYTYDSNSNRLTMSRDGKVTYYTYNELNQLVKEGSIVYTYDDAGNLMTKSDNGVLLASFEYNSRNQLVKATIITDTGTKEESYTYNYLGDRTSKTSNGATTYYTLDYSRAFSQNLVVETGTQTTFYVRGLDLISGTTNDLQYFYLHDGGKNVRILTDKNGVITDKYDFDVFGNTLNLVGNSGNEYRFQGEQQDETGLYYLRARYMNPATSVFTSMDTYIGSIEDPISFNNYLFANSNPVKYCDPSGHMSLEEQETTLLIVEMLFSAAYSALDKALKKDSDDLGGRIKTGATEFFFDLSKSIGCELIGGPLGKYFMEEVGAAAFGAMILIFLFLTISMYLLSFCIPDKTASKVTKGLGDMVLLGYISEGIMKGVFGDRTNPLEKMSFKYGFGHLLLGFIIGQAYEYLMDLMDYCKPKQSAQA